MKEVMLSRREREKQRQRKEIMAAALSLFSEKGYYAVSMQEIAEQAEFAVGTLYKFFKSKGELYQETMLGQADVFIGNLFKALDEPLDEVAKLRGLIRMEREYFLNNASRIRFFHAELRMASDSTVAELESKILQKRRQILAKVADIFENGMQKGVFRRIGKPYHLSLGLDNIVHAFLILWLEEPDKHPFPEDPDVILNILFKGLLEE